MLGKVGVFNYKDKLNYIEWGWMVIQQGYKFGWSYVFKGPSIVYVCISQRPLLVKEK